MSNKRLKITTQGWLVLGAIFFLIVALVIILIVVKPGSCSKETPAGSPVSGAATPDPNATEAPTAVPTQAPTEAPTPEPVVEPLANAVYTEPTAEMISYQVTGVTNVIGATLRAGPSKDAAEIEKRIAEGSALTIYQDFGQWVFCKVDALDKFGYIFREFVTPAASMYMPTTDQPAGTFLGTINANVLTLRSAASLTSEELGNGFKDQIVYIHYVTGEFYYVTCAGSGEKGFMKSSYVVTTDVIPAEPAA